MILNNELEKYVDTLLHTTKGLVTDEVYQNVSNKRPKRNVA